MLLYGKFVSNCFTVLAVGLYSYINIDDLQNLLGNSTEYLELWRESLQLCRTISDGITFDDFKTIIEGQPNKDMGSMHRSKGGTELLNSSSSYKVHAYNSPANIDHGTKNFSDMIPEESPTAGSPLSPRHCEQHSQTSHFKASTHWNELGRSESFSSTPFPIACG